MDQRENIQLTLLQRPITADRKQWISYWREQGQSWRIEPEIDLERQKYLDSRRAIAPNLEQDEYPFKGVKLNRADIEWLLTTHEGGRGPIDWADESQRERKGLDVRGADLRYADLRRLPLASLCGGTSFEWSPSIADKSYRSAVLLEGAYLNEAHLEGANLDEADLRGANLSGAYLQEANLHAARLQGAYLSVTCLERANLYIARMQGVNLYMANLQGADLRGAHLQEAVLEKMSLADENQIGPWLADIEWGNSNLAVVKWFQIKIVRDEYEARQKRQKGKMKDPTTRLVEYENAVRADRQLAIALQSQGLNEDAARFAYYAQKLQRVVLRRKRKFGSYLFSGFLDLIAGYGYKPKRSVVWYLIMICAFATAYFFFGHLPLLPDAIVFSIMSFHGRGFFPSLSGAISLHNPLVILAAVEAIIGLLIEISFIATFTQRFFGK